jgi:hypothetical protein
MPTATRCRESQSRSARPRRAPAAPSATVRSTISVVSDVNGNAQAILTANQIAGTFQVNATAAGRCPCNGSSPVLRTCRRTSPSLRRRPGMCQPHNRADRHAEAGSSLCLLVTDAQNNPVVSGLTVTFSAPTSGAGINLSSTTVTTGAEGLNYPGTAVLSPIGVSNGTTGQYQVTATIGSLSLPITFTNTATPPAITQIFNTGGPQSAAVRTQFASPLLVIPQDANGECLAQVPVTFSAPTSGPSATLSAQTVTTDPVTCSRASDGDGQRNCRRTVQRHRHGRRSQCDLRTHQHHRHDHADGDRRHATGNPAGNGLSGASAGQSPRPERQSTGVPTSLSCRPPRARARTFPPPAWWRMLPAPHRSAPRPTVRAGSYQVMALFGSARATFSLSNVTPGAITATGGTPQSTAPGSAFSTPLQATVTDSERQSHQPASR